MSLRTLLCLLIAAGSALAAAEEPAGEAFVYKTIGQRHLRLWVLRASSAADAKDILRPAIVLYHGGGWTGGGPNAFNPQSRYLAFRGMVAIQVEYRLLNPKNTAPPDVCIQDSKSAMRWIRSHARQFDIDPDRIAASGGSAGGYLAAFLGLMTGMDDPQDDRSASVKPAALVLYNPVFDNGPAGWGYERVGERFMEYSPFHHVSATAPPTLVLSGAEDQLLPMATVLEFQRKMREAGVKCEVVIYPHQGHGFFHRGHCYYDTLSATEQFLISLGWLKGASTLEMPEAAKDASCGK